MENRIKYTHTNLIANDWRKLSQFYIDVFGCKPQLPERDLSGDWIDKATSISNVRIRGVHLALPGYENGPTLEIFEYHPGDTGEEEHRINDMGFSHIAFHVDSVEEVLKKLLEHGGTRLGDVVVKEYVGIGLLTMVYARDPEGNIIEIQNWKK